MSRSLLPLAFFLVSFFAANARAQETPADSLRPRLAIQTGQRDDVTHVTFSPDGRLMASHGANAFETGTVVVWHVETEAQLYELQGTGRFAEVAFSPDGERLVSRGRKGVRVYDVVSGALLYQFGAGSATSVLAEALAGSEIMHRAGRWATPSIRVASTSSTGKRTLTRNKLGRYYSYSLWDTRSGDLLRTSDWSSGAPSGALLSPDGRHVVEGQRDGVVVVYAADTGEVVMRVTSYLASEADAVSSVYKLQLRFAMSSDGRLLATTMGYRSLLVWRVPSGELVHALDLERPYSAVVPRFAPDGSTLLAYMAYGLSNFRPASFPEHYPEAEEREYERKWAAWDPATGHRRFTINAHHSETAVISPQGEAWATDSPLSVYSLRTGEQLLRLEENGEAHHVQAFSPDGRLLVSAGAFGEEAGSTLYLHDTEVGREVARLADFTERPRAAVFSPDKRFLTVEAEGLDEGSRRLRVWSLETGAVAREFEGHELGTPAFTPDGLLVTLDTLDQARLYRLPSDEPVATLPPYEACSVNCPGQPDTFAFVQGGQMAAGWEWQQSSSYYRGVGIYDLPAGVLRRSIALPPRTHENSSLSARALSPDGRWFAVSEEFAVREGGPIFGRVESEDILLEHPVYILDAETGKVAHTFEADAFVFRAEFLDDQTLRTWARVPYSEASTVNLRPWELAATVQEWNLGAGTGTQARLEATSHLVDHDCDYRFARNGIGQKLSTIYDARTGERLYRLVSEGNDEFLVERFSPDCRWITAIDPSARRVVWFSAETGEEIAYQYSFADGSWLVVTPDGRFDAPDLEAIRGAVWVAPDAPLTPVPIEAFMADFYEPRLLPRLLEGEAFPDIKGLLERNRVQPEVEITGADYAADGTASVTVEVASAERTYGGEPRTSGVHDVRLFRGGQLVAWADGEVLNSAGRETLTFDGLAVPSVADTLAFSAYAFNRDRVKSRTAYADLIVPAGAVPERPRRAYVISLGVNRFADSAWDLSFAADDARQYQAVLSGGLEAAGTFDEVVLVPLIADAGPDTTNARKATLQGVLGLLAGRDMPDALRQRITNADRLEAATPADLVIVTASTHGYTDEAGVFYLLPEDIPAETGGRITPELLKSAISSDDLTAWLRGVDAGELALVVDACHAAAAVEGSGFKPGPMGSRGLGQLAFNKGMRILTATQSADVALESAQLRQGLLSFALVENGLRAGQADAAPSDGRVSLGEWLRYGAERVPTLYEEMRSGVVQTFGVEAFGGRGTEPVGEVEKTQLPALFDFRKRTAEQETVLRAVHGDDDS